MSALTGMLLLSGSLFLSGHPIPTGRMTGGGWFVIGTAKVTHGFELHCETSDPPNNLEVNWGGNHFHLDTLTASNCFDTDPPPNPPAAPFSTLFGAGTGTFNGVPGAFINFGFSDHGEPGTDDSVLYIFISDADGNMVLSGGPVLLGGGNHQAHKDNK